MDSQLIKNNSAPMEPSQSKIQGTPACGTRKLCIVLVLNLALLTVAFLAFRQAHKNELPSHRNPIMRQQMQNLNNRPANF